MAISEPFAEFLLTDADLDGGESLVAEAGWNQTCADWRIFLDLGQVVGVRTPDGTLAGTAATLPYPGGFGWISMVLVARAWRRRGIATRLLKRCIDDLRESKLTPMLDATPQGREVYRRLGFRDVCNLTRWRRQKAIDTGTGEKNVRVLVGGDLASLVTLDAKCFGCDRSKLLERLMARSRGFSCVAESNGQVRGFLLGRDGRTATQFGPLVAEDQHTAAALLNFGGHRIDSPVVLDALDRHDAFARCLQDCGFVNERPFTRMIFSFTKSFGDSRQLFAIAGPELG